MREQWIETHKQQEQGYTLVELLMVLAILGILMVAIQTIFVAGINVYHRGEAESEARRQLYYASEQIIKMVRNTPASKVTLKGTTNGVYDQLELVSSSGTVTRFYLSGDKLYRDEAGNQRMVAEQIQTLSFSVNCDVTAGTYETYDPVTKKMTDLQGSFATHDPGLKGMVARFEVVMGGTTRYIYRKITDVGPNWIVLESGFTAGFQPTNTRYAIGKTYEIYVKNREVKKDHKGSEVTAGVTPRF